MSGRAKHGQTRQNGVNRGQTEQNEAKWDTRGQKGQNIFKDGDCPRDGDHHRDGDYPKDCGHPKDFYHPTGLLLS